MKPDKFTIVDIIQSVAGICTILTFLYLVYKYVSSDNILLLSAQNLVVIIFAFAVLVSAFGYVKIYSIHKSSKVMIVKNNHILAHMSRDLYITLNKLIKDEIEKAGNGNTNKINFRLIDETIVYSITHLLDCLSETMSEITKTEIYVLINRFDIDKLVSVRAQEVNAQNLSLKIAYHSRNLDNIVKNVTGMEYKLQNLFEYGGVLGRGYSFGRIEDMEKYFKEYARDSGMPIESILQNRHDDLSKRIKSKIFVPLRRESDVNIRQYPKNIIERCSKECDWLGFLVACSTKKGVFRSKNDKIQVNQMCAFSDILYMMLERYNFYKNYVNEFRIINNYKKELNIKI